MTNLSLLLAFLLAFSIRLIALNQSLWLDEATTARVVMQYDLLQIIPKFSINDFHPPLYYLFMELWTNLFGYSEIMLRLPSVIFSLLAGLFVYKIGQKLKDKNVGFWASLLFLFNPLIIYYSQEARMYMLATFLLAVSLYYFVSLTKAKNKDRLPWRHIFWFNFTTCLAFLTFYGSIFFIAAMLIFLVVKKEHKVAVLLSLGLLASLLILAPLLLTQYRHSKLVLMEVVNWKNALGTANLKNLLLIPLKFSIGRISFEPKLLYYLVSGIWSVLVFFYVFKGLFKKNVRFMGFLLIVPITLGSLFSIFSPLLQYFRFLYLLVPLVLILVVGTAKNWQKLAVFSGFLVWTLAYLLFPSFHRENWKSLAKTLPKNMPVYMISSSADPLLYYNPSIKVNDLRSLEKKAPTKEIIIIPYAADIHGVDYERPAQQQGYIKTMTITVRGLTAELWQK